MKLIDFINTYIDSPLVKDRLIENINSSNNQLMDWGFHSNPIASSIDSAFIWGSSKEGGVFWRNIHNAYKVIERKTHLNSFELKNGVIKPGDYIKKNGILYHVLLIVKEKSISRLSQNKILLLRLDRIIDETESYLELPLNKDFSCRKIEIDHKLCDFYKKLYKVNGVNYNFNKIPELTDV